MVLVEIKNALLPRKTRQQLPNLLPETQMETCTTKELYTDDKETASTHPRIVSDIIIGLSDGLTVPFALTAGLSSLGDSRLVITGGLAELISGAISMGIGGFLAASSESEYFQAQCDRERVAYRKDPSSVAEEIHEALAEYNISSSAVKMMMADLERDEDQVVAFVVKMVRNIEEPADGREVTSALTIGFSYFMGGFVPLIPYFFATSVVGGLVYSAVLMAIALFVFGIVKTKVLIGSDIAFSKCLWSGCTMLFTGGLAAVSAWSLVKFIQ